jgi:hypothetical protein
MFIFFYRVVDLHFFTVFLTRISLIPQIPQMPNLLFQRNLRYQRLNIFYFYLRQKLKLPRCLKYFASDL